MLVADIKPHFDAYYLPQALAKPSVVHSRRAAVGDEYMEVVFSANLSEQKRAQARDLLNTRYGQRGYSCSHNLHSDLYHTTFVAEIDQQVVGTMTLAVDSQFGLAIDRTFKDLIAEVRREGNTRLCELTKLAFADGVRSKEVLAGLFHMAFIYGTGHTNCTDLMIEVNPRHVRFYETMLGFRCVGGERLNMSVRAPSQLMRIGVDEIKHNISDMGRRPRSTGRHSLYRHFFPQEEERQVRRLLEAALLGCARALEQPDQGQWDDLDGEGSRGVAAVHGEIELAQAV